MKNTEMKFLTYYNVFKMLQDNCNLTRRDIQKNALLSWGTVSSIVNDLLSFGMIKEKESDVIVSGVRPKILEINDTNNFVVGININNEDLTIVLTDFSYRIKSSYSTKPKNFNKDDVLKYLFKVLDKLFSEYKIYFICISMSNQINREMGVSIAIPSIEGWDNVPIVDIMQKRYNVPTSIQHDPDCILSNQKHTDRNNKRNCVLLRIGEGIGISAMINNKIYISSPDSGIEIEHSIMVPNGNQCKCGKKGCYGAYCSLYSLRNKLENKLKRKITNDEIKEIVNSSEDKEIKEIIDSFIKNIAIMCYNILTLYNPQVLYLEGIFDEIDRDFKAKLTKYIDELYVDRKCQLSFINFEKENSPVGAIISSRADWLKYALSKIIN